MATSIAQRWCLLSGYSCINRLSNRQVNQPCAERNTLIRRYIHLSVVGYRSRGGTHDTQDAHDAKVHVPVDRLTVSYSRSSGPGGQHVNKVSTKAEVRFHVKTADWIAEDVRQKIFEKNKTRINKAGELLVTSELSRSQQRNLGDCIQKISDIIAEASEKPYEPTAEEIAIRESRLDKRNKERLKQKKMLSTTKQSRRVDFD